MRGAVLYAPGEGRLDQCDDPSVINRRVIRMSATCACGSDLWDYRGINTVTGQTLPPVDARYRPTGLARSKISASVGQAATARRTCGAS